MISIKNCPNETLSDLNKIFVLLIVFQNKNSPKLLKLVLIKARVIYGKQTSNYSTNLGLTIIKVVFDFPVEIVLLKGKVVDVSISYYKHLKGVGRKSLN